MSIFSVTKNKTLRSFIFLLLFIFTFFILQYLFIPKWYYPNTNPWDPMSRIMSGYYEEDVPIEVVIIGTSHSLFGLSPMEMYEKYGIKAYNLSSIAQPIQGSYFWLCEAIRINRPKVVVFDCSKLFSDSSNEVDWRYMLDTMKFSINKMNFAKVYSQDVEEGTYLSGVFPMIRYHTRWKELSERDFTDFFRNRKFYSKGYYMVTTQEKSGVTQDEMNEHERILKNQSSIKYEKIYDDDRYWIEEKDSILYSNSFVDENIGWLYKIIQLCEDNNIELLLTKVPVVHSPIDYRSAWTKEKSDSLKKLCSIWNVSFLDLQYDVQTEIDWKSDTCDSGRHLNFLGAQKTSDILGNYLVSRYKNLSVNHCESWDLDFRIYQEVRKLAQLKMEENFNVYLNKLKELRQVNDKIWFFAVAYDDMSGGLSENDKDGLRSIGIKMNFENAYRDSFISIINGEEINYERLSNRAIFYKNDFGSFVLELNSAGGLTGEKSSIKINGVEYVVGKRGINIVVYDAKKDIVLDSVCFDTAIYEHEVTRDRSRNFNLMRKYETYLIENENYKDWVW